MHGTFRRASTFNTERIDHIYEDPHEAHRRLFLHYGDLTDTIITVRKSSAAPGPPTAGTPDPTSAHDLTLATQSTGEPHTGARMSLNELEVVVVVDKDGGLIVSPSVVARLGARPGEHLRLIRSKPGRQSRPKKMVGVILEGKISASGQITDEDFAAAKAECIDAAERRFGPPQ